MGFIIQPALQKDWELTGNPDSLASVVNAAHALASRYSPTVGAIRSWDTAINHRYNLISKADNFLVIVDSMCNLDLLYYVAHHTQDASLATIATTHAHAVRSTILRPDFSSYHLVNFDPSKPSTVQSRLTNQGYSDSSTWTRGQAWAIMGFAQTYYWTSDLVFLDTAIGCANMFLARLSAATHHHPLVPAWDFDAPHDDPAEPLRDTSAGVIAANGLLLIHQALQGLSSEQRASRASPPAGPQDIGGDFLDVALSIVRQTLDMSLDRDFARLAPPLSAPEGTGGDKSDDGLRAQIVPSGFDAILRNATVNNHEHSHRRYVDHGLVYADYYLLEFGNKLCRMGLC